VPQALERRQQRPDNAAIRVAAALQPHGGAVIEGGRALNRPAFAADNDV
jgi:hypothetical protein